MSVLAAVHSRAGLDLLVAVRASGGLSDDPVAVVTWSQLEIPEVGATDLAAEVAAAGFAQVIDLDALLRPFHPAQWNPHDAELALVRALLVPTLAPVTELFLEDVDHHLCRVLTKVFDGAGVHALAVGLSAYGPPSHRRPPALQQRIEALWYLDHLPGVRPVCVEPSNAMPAPPVPTAAATHTLVLGSDLVAARIGDAAAERRAHLRLLRTAAASGGEVVFRPPSLMGPGQLRLLEWEAAQAGIDLDVVDAATGPWGQRGRPAAAFGFTAPELAHLHSAGVLVAAPTTAELLARLSPYHHRARIELTIIDALLSAGPPGYQSQELQQLLMVVSYLMRPESLPELGGLVESQLAELSPRARGRYLDQGRLVALGLAARPTRAARLRNLIKPGGWRRLKPGR